MVSTVILESIVSLESDLVLQTKNYFLLQVVPLRKYYHIYHFLITKKGTTSTAPQPTYSYLPLKNYIESPHSPKQESPKRDLVQFG